MATAIPQPVIYPIKRGDSFQPIVTVSLDGDLGPFAFDDWNVRCMIRDPKNNRLISGTTVIWHDHSAGIYQLFATVDTNQWTTGNAVVDAVCDIEYTTDTGEITSTETFIVRITPDVTRNDPSDPDDATAI